MKQEIPNAKLKCRFCGAIFVCSAQSKNHLSAPEAPKPSEEFVVEQTDVITENCELHTQPDKEQTVDKPEVAPQHIVVEEVMPNAVSDIPETVNNPQLIHNTKTSESPVLEIPVAVTPVEAIGGRNGIIPQTQLMLKWIIAGAIVCVAIGLFGLIMIKNSL